MSEFCWSPQVPQANALSCSGIIDELFYGGAAGSGKSDFLLADAAADVDQGLDWCCIMFRRNSQDMDSLVARSQQMYLPMGAEYKVGARTWIWPSGATLKFRPMDTDDQFFKFMGHAYSGIYWDELPTWGSMRPYHLLKSRLRGNAKHKRIRATGNPGGMIHSQIKDYFQIGKYPNGYVPLRDPASDMVRCFIPAKVTDNQKLLDADPDYPKRLMSMGDPELTEAYLHGNWDINMGSYYAANRNDLIVDPFEIPENWSLFVSMDYGEVNETAAVLIAVDSDDDCGIVNSYESSGAGAEHARGIKAMIEECAWTRCGGVYGRWPRLILAPADMWTKRAPGEVALARSPSDSFRDEGLHLTRANMDRVNGWRNIGNLIYNKRIKFFRGYTDATLESLLGLQRDTRNMEDASSPNDHSADALRYGINHCYKPRNVSSGPQADGGRLIDQLTESVIEGRYA